MMQFLSASRFTSSIMRVSNNPTNPTTSSPERIPQTTLRAILTYANHPSSINTIKKYSRNHRKFFFSVVEKEDLIKELHILNPKKITQETDIPVKALKDNKDFFVGYF